MGSLFSRVKSPLVNKLVNVTVPKSGDLKPTGRIRDASLNSVFESRGRNRFRDDFECRGRHCVYGFNTGGYAPTAYASNKHNEYEALYARVVCATPVPDIDTMEDFVSWCKQNHKLLFMRMNNIRPISFEAYLAGSNASPSVKRILQKTHDRLVNEGIDEWSDLTTAQQYMYSYRSSFVKVENGLYSTPAGVSLKAPRLIQGATPEFICLVGPWIAAFQILLKRRWGKDNFLCFTSGLTARQVASVIDVPGWQIMMDDVSTWDASVDRRLCEYEVWLAKHMNAPKAVVSLMHANIATHGSTKHGWKYKVDGGRKSGDPYTSVMNSILNALLHLFIYCRHTGKSVEQAKLSLRMVVQGDDNVLIHAEPTHFSWKDEMRRLGFKAVASYVELNDLEFCSNRLYRTDQGLVFGPKPGKVLAKFGYIVNPPIGVSRESLMRGVCLGIQQATRFIPPIRAVVDRVLELTTNHKAVVMHEFIDHKMKGDKVEYSVDQPSIMEQLNHVYNWTTDCQSMFEEHVASMQLGDDMQFGTSRMLFDRDTSGPQIIYSSFGHLGTLRAA
jgi:hypothetical protein